jgi:hypothetical protein
MPYDLLLPRDLARLWKVKIQDKEALYEEPHVTIWRRDMKWRYSLRRLAFLDPQPDPGQVPARVLAMIERNHSELCRQWDARFPTNPIAGEEDDDD